MRRLNQSSYIYIYILAAFLISLTSLSFFILTSSTTSAESVVSNVAITIPVSCNLNSTLDSPHTATINNGTFAEDIGTTTFKVFCNDSNGFSVYAIGYSNEEFGNTNMLATVNGSLAPSFNIATGLATSGDTSNWAMKLTKVAGLYEPTILSDANGSFADYHVIPTDYTKVATLASNTDFTSGSSFQSTYRAYISGTQPAGTYAGKVRYVIVHPNDEDAPLPGITLSEAYEMAGKTKANGYYALQDMNTAICDAATIVDE